MYAIPNSIVYVETGSITVYYYPVNSKAGADTNQNSSQFLPTASLIMSVTLNAGQYLFIPSGRLFILQATNNSTVIISRFLCGLEMKRQITSYRQLYNDNVRLYSLSNVQYDEMFKWQFWKVNWLAAFLYIRSLRIAQNVKVGPCCLQDISISPEERLYIPFLIVALKILHEIYGSKQNPLQQFEAVIAEKVGALGPLDALMELATRCRDNFWKEKHGIYQPGR